MIQYRPGILKLLLIVAFVPPAFAQPPAHLLRRVAGREAATEAERANYAYSQRLRLQEAGRGGRYEETREVIFLPGGGREERALGRPVNDLKQLLLTPEDFEDLRKIQPLLITPENLRFYESRFRGEEAVDGLDCWVIEVKPRQIFPGVRYFEGLLFVDKTENAVVRIDGKAVPPIYRDGKENLFPRFVTIRKKVDGRHWFPALTWADDVLPFKTGGVRIRLEVRFENYRRFGADSTITYEPAPPPR